MIRNAETERAGRDYDVCIVGGAGHVGLPLALAFANAGQRVVIYDVAREALDVIGKGVMPFIEYDAEPLLKTALASGNLLLTSSAAEIARCRHVIITIGTPVDEYLNPKLRALLDLIETLRPHLDPGQTIVIRSTVYPKTTRMVERTLNTDGRQWSVAYCPERIAQGYAIRELRELPQIVSGCSPEALESARALFQLLAPTILTLEVEEAELAKLFSNAWRYVQFATANQFYMIADSIGVDFNHVRQAMVDGYGRAASLPTAGFAAGPCLLKDTMQLAAFNQNNFTLGHAAMAINEGLPNFIVDRLGRRHTLREKTVGILGMAFKADIDDIRDSLSYKLGKVLRFNGATVQYSDEFVHDPTFLPKEDLVASSDIVIVGVPHSAYKHLVISERVDVVDLWGILPKRSEP
jgi:UDP-N-acetyl-D-mannosaminuronic acid dehydrogenase